MVAFLNSQNFHENPVLAHGPIPELLAHGPINGGTFFLKNSPKPRLGPWACLRGITVYSILLPLKSPTKHLCYHLC